MPSSAIVVRSRDGRALRTYHRRAAVPTPLRVGAASVRGAFPGVHAASPRTVPAAPSPTASAILGVRRVDLDRTSQGSHPSRRVKSSWIRLSVSRAVRPNRSRVHHHHDTVVGEAGQRPHLKADQSTSRALPASTTAAPRCRPATGAAVCGALVRLCSEVLPRESQRIETDERGRREFPGPGGTGVHDPGGVMRRRRVDPPLQRREVHLPAAVDNELAVSLRS
jgi:hypothetical protein